MPLLLSRRLSRSEWVFCILMTAGRCDDHRFSFFFEWCCEHLWVASKCIDPGQWSVVWEGMICIIVAFMQASRLGMKCCCRYLLVYKRRYVAFVLGLSVMLPFSCDLVAAWKPGPLSLTLTFSLALSIFTACKTRAGDVLYWSVYHCRML